MPRNNAYQVADPTQNPMISPYYIHPGESTLISAGFPPLTGRNYHSWARSMRRMLILKNKFKFVDGTIRVPTSFEANYEAWERCNNMVHTWIMSSLSPSIAQSVVDMDNALEVWNDLKERFSQGDLVPPSKTMITPVQCKTLWRQFKMETEYSVTQAIAAQEANNRNNNWLPPPWAIVALVILGFNEFMTVLRNPMYLALIFVGYLLLKALWVQLDIAGEFRHGALPGIISLSSKFIPIIMNLVRKLAEEGNVTNNPRENPSKNNHGAATAGGATSSSASSHITSSDSGTEYTRPSKYE